MLGFFFVPKLGAVGVLATLNVMFLKRQQSYQKLDNKTLVGIAWHPFFFR